MTKTLTPLRPQGDKDMMNYRICTCLNMFICWTFSQREQKKAVYLFKLDRHNVEASKMSLTFHQNNHKHISVLNAAYH